MKNEDYLNSDDLEVATLYANIIYQEKGIDYLIKVLEPNYKYFLEENTFKKENKIQLQKIDGNGLYQQIKSSDYISLPRYNKEKIMEAFNKIFKKHKYV